MPDQKSSTRDPFCDWLLGKRYGFNGHYRSKLATRLECIRDRVLNGALLKEGVTLLDVGAGEGLVGFGAIDRLGSSIRVIMTDVSMPILEHTRSVAMSRGVDTQCTFLQGSADRLDGIADASVDVVTTRAVLAYVSDKPSAMHECYRVLRSGGRLSIAEPIVQDEALEVIALTRLIDATPNHPEIEFLRLMQRWRAAQYPSTEAETWRNPLTNYAERDILRMALEAGFVQVHLELHVDVIAADITEWDLFLDVSPHPTAPPLRKILVDTFSEDERNLFERVMRPRVESGETMSSQVIAYLTANKPV